MTTEEPYDSREDTEQHIMAVNARLNEIRGQLAARGALHDLSKLSPPEKDTFDAVTPRLKSMTYGSPEYKAALAEMKPALDHHYANNRHHCEHFMDGICDMNLIDLCEMLADWKAAGERHADGSMSKSLKHNSTRFKIPDVVFSMLVETCVALGWITEAEAEALLKGDA